MTRAAVRAPLPEGTAGARPTRTRWVVVTLLFVLYTVNCVDRGSVSVGLPDIARDLTLSGTVQGVVLSAFFWSYSLLQIPGGWAVDRLGPRRVIGVAGALWGLFQAVAGFAVNGVMLVLTRVGLGAFEAPFMPAASRVTASWLTRKENARGITLIDSGAPLGSAVGGLAVAALITVTGSWRASFVIIGALSVLLSVAICLYIRNHPREHPHVNAAEARLVEAGQASGAPGEAGRAPTGGPALPDVEGADGAAAKPAADAALPPADRAEGAAEPAADTEAVRHAGTGGAPAAARNGATPGNLAAMVVGRIGWAAVFWGLVTWGPSYLTSARGLSTAAMGAATFVIFTCGAAGEITSGFVSGWLQRRLSPNVALRTLFGGSGLIGLLSLVALPFVHDSGAAVVVLCAGVFFHLWGGLYWIVPALLAPPERIGVVGGLMNFAGTAAGIAVPIVAGILVDATGGYTAVIWLFTAFAVVYIAGSLLLRYGRRPA